MLATNRKKFWNVLNSKYESNIGLQSSHGRDIPVTQSASALNYVFIMSFTTYNVNQVPVLSFPAFLSMNPETVDAIAVAGIIKKYQAFILHPNRWDS